MSSIKDIGYMDFFNHPCVCIQDGMDLILVPQKPEDNILPLSYIHKDRLSVKFIITWLRHIIVWQLNGAKQMALNILRNNESVKKYY